MNPIPLTDPSGVVRAWACGCCFQPGAATAKLVSNADEKTAESSKSRAETCCTCHDCKGSAPRAGRRWFGLCLTCGDKRAADVEAHRVAMIELYGECHACGGHGGATVSWDNRCTECDGRGWLVPKDEASR